MEGGRRGREGGEGGEAGEGGEGGTNGRKRRETGLERSEMRVKYYVISAHTHGNINNYVSQVICMHGSTPPYVYVHYQLAIIVQFLQGGMSVSCLT